MLCMVYVTGSVVSGQSKVAGLGFGNVFTFYGWYGLSERI